MAVVEFHPRSIEEARVARRHYARVSPNLAARFVVELDAAVLAIGMNPAAGPPHSHGTRVRRLGRFRHLLVYLELTPARVLVVAVAHGHRRPGYWRRRLP
ncbi:Plasmid stabilization system protein OS=Synechococcus sp. RS9917 GN=RS9917_11136 PE=4 SV=1: Plasmid_stabil [Gemmataceae bacterium]|nr:Plasmid stabilization system protein OS=Synechococcus sp. RS9917 GN=RS9917_11136 PE=4 SV=1: Plasmid_stabil [Gemmataceae bacterium]VTT97015.1 Plasmid stabilization system protein OS=Synechococcus sp. RS9917 GN=RS9917_11136 PE=4 SV=1: Plasmid_stabil [Gemmataceae bacterium]